MNNNPYNKDTQFDQWVAYEEGKMTKDICSECGGRTIDYSGKGLNTQYKICSRYKEPGHKSEEEIKRELANVRRMIRPSGRFA